MIWNGSLYNLSSILVLFRWKNWRNWLARPILVVGPSLAIWGMEPSRAILRHQKILFWVNTLQVYPQPLDVIHIDTFSTV
jgi:hypothetical protein